ncbi:glutamine amidotransferase-related protein, partial [Salmonella sp. SAL4432]
MERLRAHRLDALIPRLTQPVLGICLGMQLLYEASEEGETQCLGTIPG